MDPANRQRLMNLMPERLSFAARAWRRHGDVRPLLCFVPRHGVVVDVGANRGVYTYWFARRAERVHAFEPLPDCAAYLERNAPPNVTVHHAALGARPGVAALTVPHEDRNASLRPGLRGGESVDVEVTPLDQVGVGRVDFMKVDVEGFEMQVLDGAAETMRSLPTLYIEVEQRHLEDTPITEVFDAIRSIGYPPGWAHLPRRGFVPLTEFDVERDQLDQVDDVMSDRYVHNFLFTSPAMSNLVNR